MMADWSSDGFEVMEFEGLMSLSPRREREDRPGVIGLRTEVGLLDVLKSMSREGCESLARNSSPNLALNVVETGRRRRDGNCVTLAGALNGSDPGVRSKVSLLGTSKFCV
jgi:hypothetical protein